MALQKHVAARTWLSLFCWVSLGGVLGYVIGMGVGELATPMTGTIGDALRFAAVRLWSLHFALVGAAVGAWMLCRARISP